MEKISPHQYTDHGLCTHDLLKNTKTPSLFFLQKNINTEDNRDVVLEAKLNDLVYRSVIN